MWEKLSSLVVKDVYAKSQAEIPKTIAGGITDIGIESINDVFVLAINVLLGAAVALSLIFMLLGGIMYIMSKGDPKEAATARGYLTNAVIGLLIAIGVFTVRTIVLAAIGADSFIGVTGVFTE